MALMKKNLRNKVDQFMRNRFNQEGMYGKWTQKTHLVPALVDLTIQTKQETAAEIRELANNWQDSKQKADLLEFIDKNYKVHRDVTPFAIQAMSIKQEAR